MANQKGMIFWSGGLLVLLLAVAVLTKGCESKTSNNAPSDGTYTVGQEGGTVRYVNPSNENISLQIDIPPGSVPAGTQIQIGSRSGSAAGGKHVSVEPAGSGDYPDNGNVARGTVFGVGPADLVFDPPATVTITYDETVLGDLIENELAQQKVMDGTWQKIPSTIDIDANTVTSPITVSSFRGVVVDEPPPPPDPIFLYQAESETNSNFGPRTNADAICTAEKPAALSCPNGVRAFVSFGDDDIVGFPANYSVPVDSPIQGPTGIQVAANWDDLLDGSIGTSLQSAAVLPDGNTWWSGSDEFGVGTTDNCELWTHAGSQGFSNEGEGTIGTATDTDTSWIKFINPDPVIHAVCDNIAVRGLLCMCY